MARTRLPHGEVTATDGLDDWRVVLRALRGTFTTPSFEAAGELVAAIAAEADRRDHHPDVSLGYPGTVRVTLTTHSAGGITELDIDFALAISALARDAGAAADPSAAQTVELAIDTMDAGAIRPFWAAVLDYSVDDQGNLSDPRGIGPDVWFQQMDEPRTDRNRFHLDIVVPHDEADARIAATLAAGGRLVSDDRARAWWVLADADGNEACICTWEDRSTS